MSREKIIKISRSGPDPSWHNKYIGQQFNTCMDESLDSFQLNINDSYLWIDKKYVDVSVNGKWTAGSKYKPQE